jgi:CheY-like chemotaxis protein
MIGRMTPSLLIVDDHATFRRLAHALLEAAGYDVTEAADGEAALEQVRRLHPDIVLLDVQLPGIDGFEVASRLSRQASPPVVVLTSSRTARDYGSRLLEAPVRGFIRKDELSGDALAALVADG